MKPFSSIRLSLYRVNCGKDKSKAIILYNMWHLKNTNEHTYTQKRITLRGKWIIIYATPPTHRYIFTFKCHRSNIAVEIVILYQSKECVCVCKWRGSYSGRSKAFNMHEILLLSSVDIFLCIFLFVQLFFLYSSEWYLFVLFIFFFFQFNEFLFVQVIKARQATVSI